MIAADPETVSWARIILATSVVAVLLIGLGFGLRYLRNRGFLSPSLGVPTGTRRLNVTETMPLDMRRRLVVVRFDDTEHLLLLGQDRDILLETRPLQNQQRLPPSS